jgi:chaperonin GroES
LIPVTCQVGDKVLLPEYGGNLVKIGGDEELHLFRDDDNILGKFEINKRK